MRWHADGEPGLGDLAYETVGDDNGTTLERAFVVVGVEETASRRRWDLILERMAWDAFVAATEGDAPVWTFERDRRR